MKKNFVGNVKPHIELDKMSLSIKFGEPFALEDWQTSHPQFQFALKNGWVVSSDKGSLILNTLENTVAHAPYSSAREAVTSTHHEAVTKLAQNGVDPAVLQELLEQQSLVMRGIAESVQSPAPTKDNDLLKELLNQNRQMLELMASQRSAPQSPDVVNLLKEIKDSLANPKGTGTYNKGSAQSDGFRVVEVEPEKFVSKIEDLNVKSANIVTQEHKTDSTDDALAVLKKMKGK